jgi:hypothetical protein
VTAIDTDLAILLRKTCLTFFGMSLISSLMTSILRSIVRLVRSYAPSIGTLFSNDPNARIITGGSSSHR